MTGVETDDAFLARPVASVTGGTGFLGRFIVRALDAAGYRVRLLVRGDPMHPQFQDLRLEIVPGDLNNPEALARLAEGVAVLVHGAGLIKARDRAGFMAVNRDGSRAVAEAMAGRAPDARLVVVSSMAAREPELSDYAGSKWAGEEAALAAFGHDRALIARPPAIYGPWDRETLAVFKAAQGPVVPVLGGPGARIALIHAQDCAAAIAVLAARGTPGRVYELSDQNPGGYAWGELLDAAAAALGTSPRRVPVTAAALRLVGAIGGLRARLTGEPVMLNTGKVREMLHLDWSARPDKLPPPDLWQPTIGLDNGFRSVAEWYRSAGWLS